MVVCTCSYTLLLLYILINFIIRWWFSFFFYVRAGHCLRLCCVRDRFQLSTFTASLQNVDSLFYPFPSSLKVYKNNTKILTAPLKSQCHFISLHYEVYKSRKPLLHNHSLYVLYICSKMLIIENFPCIVWFVNLYCWMVCDLLICESCV